MIVIQKVYGIKIKSKPDVVIFEGWCVGAKAQTNAQSLKNQ